jgi:uncharacterized protein YndB with AHSA1/START domain
VASAEWLYLSRAPSGAESRRQLQDDLNFTTGNGHSLGGEYLELIPNERLRYTDKFDDPNLAGEIRVTVTLKKVSLGTEIDIMQDGIPDVIPPEACYLGWRESLRNLARLVEPDINQ